MKKSKRIMVVILLVITVFNSTNVLGEELGSWSTKANMPTGRSYFGATAAIGKIYAIGGSTGNGYTNKVEEYDPEVDEWTIKTNMPTARSGLGVVETGGKIYAIGGYNGPGVLNTVEEYNPITDKWSKKANMPTARKWFGLAEANGKIYVIGGYDKTNDLNIVEEYDPMTDKWTTKANMPTARKWFGVAEANGKIYAVAGHHKTYGFLNTVEEYDPVNNKWTTRTSMPTYKVQLGAAELNGKIYAVGGNSLNDLNTVEVYNPILDKWTTVAPMHTSRAAFGIVESNGDIYALGGRGSIILNTVEQFTITPTSAIVLNIEPNSTQTALSQTETVDLVIENITQITSGDIKIVYDKDKLEFIDFQEVSGKKLVKSIHEPEKGELRVILASEGEPNIINGKETLLKLNFKGIQTGEALVDILSGRVTDGIAMEKDLTPQQCGQATITIEDITDVNHSGEFTLLDLGIDARHLYKSPSESELSNYNTDIIIDGTIDELDLLEIAKYMLENATYAPNN